MSRKIIVDKGNKIINSSNTEKKDKKQFEANYVYEEEFWKDCSNIKEGIVIKDITENENVQEMKRKLNPINVKEKMKRNILEKINYNRENDLFHERITLRKNSSTKSLKSFNGVTKDNSSKVNEQKLPSNQEHLNNKSQKKIKTNIYDNLFGRTAKLNDSSTKINSNSIKNLKINSGNNSNSNSNNNSINNNLLQKEKPKSMNKSLSMDLLENKKYKISPSLLNLIKEEDNGKRVPKKKNFERTESLYQIRFKKNEALKIMKKQLDEYRVVYELEDCTFRPNINHDYVRRDKSPTLNPESNLSFYERVNIWKKKKLEKNDQEKKLNKTREFENCTFHPSISSNVPNFNQINTFDEGTIKYFERIQKARGERNFINSKLNFKFNENYDRTNQRKGLINLSMNLEKKDIFGTFCPLKKSNDEEIGNVRQSLRNELHSINLNDYEQYGIPEDKEVI